jgi:hypothetical protein
MQMVSIDWIASQAINVVFHDQSVAVGEAFRQDDEHRLEGERSDLTWSVDTDGGLPRSVPEAYDTASACGLSSRFFGTIRVLEAT